MKPTIMAGAAAVPMERTSESVARAELLSYMRKAESICTLCFYYFLQYKAFYGIKNDTVID
jgi:hypothetical protein